MMARRRAANKKKLAAKKTAAKKEVVEKEVILPAPGDSLPKSEENLFKPTTSKKK